MNDQDPWWPTIFAAVASAIIATLIIVAAAELGTNKALVDIITPSPKPKPAGDPIYW